MPRFLFRETKIEKKIRRELKKFNITYRQNCSIKGGHFNVDFLIDICDTSGNKISELVIEANGNYFHSHPKDYPIKEQYDLIQSENYIRDVKKMNILRTMYSYIILWEHEIKQRGFPKRFKLLFEKARSEILAGNKFEYWNEPNC